ncbi:MAG: hypothetical protein JRJ12_15815 [Deltaproteobacteria bacterium]|nr:hypothetical protein [Deltaproteobacteria bacterium]MBW2070609.1 hypothetical protein [Deltaproteobacteria bacterium]
MSELFADQQEGSEIVIATIANQKNPSQVVEIIHLPATHIFLTRGIANHFHLKEIAVPQDIMLAEIHEMTSVLSYLLEHIATAADLNLPFRYDPQFQVGEHEYHLEDSGQYMLLSRKR